MTIKYLNQQNVKALLKQDPGVKTISAEAVQWIDDVVAHVVKNLAASGRKSPSGRLMGPKMAPGLMARTVAAKEPALGEGECAIQEAVPPQVCGIVENHPEWDEYNDWQTAVKRGETKLPFEEWKNEKKT